MCLPPLTKRPAPSNAPAQQAAPEKPGKRNPPPLEIATLPQDVMGPLDFSPFQKTFSPMLKSPAVGDAFGFSWLSDYGAIYPAPQQRAAVFVPEMHDAFLTHAVSSPSVPSASPIDPLGAMDAPESPFVSEGSSESEATSKRARKRKLASDLSPLELAKMREVNRVAAQRHRYLAKKKAMEQRERAEVIGSQNEELRREVERMASEVQTLKRVVLEMYGPVGPMRGTLRLL